MENFVTYEIAVKLKEKGFDELCLLHYTNEQILVQNSTQSTIGDTIGVDDILDSYNRFNNACTDAPTISQVLKWLREEKKIFVDVNSFPTYSTKEMVAYAVDVRLNSVGYSMETVESSQSFARWEKAALTGIEYVLNNLI